MLFNRDVKRISDLVADPVLRAFAGGICVFGGRKWVPPASRSGRNLSVCCPKKKADLFWTSSMAPYPQVREKSLKKRLLERGEAPNSTTFGVPSHDDSLCFGSLLTSDLR